MPPSFLGALVFPGLYGGGKNVGIDAMGPSGGDANKQFRTAGPLELTCWRHRARGRDAIQVVFFGVCKGFGVVSCRRYQGITRNHCVTCHNIGCEFFFVRRPPSLHHEKAGLVHYIQATQAVVRTYCAEYVVTRSTGVLLSARPGRDGEHSRREGRQSSLVIFRPANFMYVL